MKLRVSLFLVASALLATPAFAQQLNAADVNKIIKQAVTRAAKISPNSVIAVTDREGNVLAVWVVRGGAAGDDEIASAVSKAGTAAYLSSNQNAFSSRTAGFIIQQHFPPGVDNAEPGPLVGVGLSNLFFSDINKFRKPGSVISFSSSPGLTILPVPFTSLDGTPGGLPLYKNNKLVGGSGVTGEIRQPIINDPFFPTPIDGQARLTATDVANIIDFAAQRVKITRAGIRLPIGTQMQVFITVVNNPNMPGVAPTVLGTFRTGEATLFSWDVAVQKARTVIHFSK